MCWRATPTTYTKTESTIGSEEYISVRKVMSRPAPVIPSFSVENERLSGRTLRNPCDDLDLEIEARQPVHAHRGPVRIGRFADRLQSDRVERLPLRCRVGVEAGHIDNVVERATSRLQHGREIVEGKLDLLFEHRLGRAVFAAADLARDEQEVARADRRRIAVDLVERLPAGRE